MNRLVPINVTGEEADKEALGVLLVNDPARTLVHTTRVALRIQSERSMLCTYSEFIHTYVCTYVHTYIDRNIRMYVRT